MLMCLEQSADVALPTYLQLGRAPNNLCPCVPRWMLGFSEQGAEVALPGYMATLLAPTDGAVWAAINRLGGSTRAVRHTCRSTGACFSYNCTAS